MEIDWPRTLAVGAITAAAMAAIYAADTYEAYRSGELSSGCAPLVGMSAGLVLGLFLANLLLT